MLPDDDSFQFAEICTYSRSGATKACRTASGWARCRSAGLVRPPSPRAPLARSAGRAARPVPGLALRSHAAADYYEGRRAVFRALYGALVECARARGGAARGRAQAVVRARLLRAREASAPLRQAGGRAPRGRFSTRRGDPRLPPPPRPLYARLPPPLPLPCP